MGTVLRHSRDLIMVGLWSQTGFATTSWCRFYEKRELRGRDGCSHGQTGVNTVLYCNRCCSMGILVTSSLMRTFNRWNKVIHTIPAHAHKRAEKFEQFHASTSGEELRKARSSKCWRNLRTTSDRWSTEKRCPISETVHKKFQVEHLVRGASSGKLKCSGSNAHKLWHARFAGVKSANTMDGSVIKKMTVLRNKTRSQLNESR